MAMTVSAREVRDRTDTWGQTRLDENETQTEFKYRNNTLSEFEDRDDTPAQVQGPAMDFTLNSFYIDANPSFIV